MLGARAGCVLRLMAGVVAAHVVLFAEAQAAMSLTLTSSAFEPGGKIPAEYTCEGEDISPPLMIGGVPDGTKSLALILDDPDAPDPAAPKRVWVHWVVYNLSPGTSALPEGANSSLPAGATDGTQRLEADRVWRSLPAHRPAPLFPQALCARHQASRKADDQGRARSRHERSYPGEGRAGGYLSKRGSVGRLYDVLLA